MMSVRRRPAVRSPAVLWATALLFTVAAVSVARSAHAEEVVLVSGARYDASEVTFLPRKERGEAAVRFTYRMGGGRATVELPFSRVAPTSLFNLKLARTRGTDGTAQLELARFALEQGLVAQAEGRFRRAAELDPTLAAARDEGLAGVKDAESERLLVAAEAELKRGRSDLAFAKAKDVKVRAVPGSALAARAEGLAELALRVIDRDRARLEAEATARAAAAAVADQNALEGALAKAHQAVGLAQAQRGMAADPAVSGNDALKALELADAHLLDARRAFSVARGVLDPARDGGVGGGGLRDEIEKRDAEVVSLLAATYLDLADLERQRRRFDRARDLVRAAGVLEPNNARVRDIRELIERDLAAPPPLPPEEYDPTGLFFSSGYVTPYASPYLSPYRTPVRRYAPTPHAHRRSVLYGPSGHHHGGHSHGGYSRGASGYRASGHVGSGGFGFTFRW